VANFHGRSIGVHRYHLVESMIHDGLNARQIAGYLGVDAETVRKFARKRGLKITPQDMAMENHSAWTGGTTRDKHGYILERVGKDGPHGYLIRTGRAEDKRGYAAQHRIRMHDKLGRQLLPDEVVHHIDGNVENNDPSNLEVFQTNADHLRETLAGKIPNWSEQGWKAMCAPRPYRQRKEQKPLPIDHHPKIDDHL